MKIEQDTIWRYLTEAMSSEERIAFDQELAINESLRTALAEERELVEYVQQKEAKAAAIGNLAEIHQEFVIRSSSQTTIPMTQPLAKSNTIVKWLMPVAIAASVLLGVLYLPSLLQQEATPQELYASHFDPSDISFSTRGIESEVSLVEASSSFNQEEYDEVLDKLNSLEVAGDVRDKVNYMKAISLIATGGLKEGRALLQELPTIYTNDAYWYEGLSYLKEGNISAAKATFSKISPNYNRYNKVSTILAALKE